MREKILRARVYPQVGLSQLFEEMRDDVTVPARDEARYKPKPYRAVLATAQHAQP